ncbi:MAG: transcriptional regulator [Proteobacteria bacterium]|nr:transcriptional regulator [Pseudomonadota bacterium]MBU4471647.1 transcriptional regulator [Pseudomonadota bacterium]MCG2751128.1 transcriptional regulator [Desulfobacteraceae bacterium]
MNSLEPGGKEDCAKTLRQAMIDLLEDGPKSAKDLSQGLKVQEKLVYDHLCHIERTIKAKGRKLVILPAKCSSCDYVFSDRKKFAKPGRCPECKRSHITAPAYEILK